MKFLFGRKGETSSRARVVSARREPDGSTGDFRLAIVGESNYQTALRKARSSLMRPDEGYEFLPVRVTCEPNNRWDRNAVRITTIGGDVLGYLSRDEAERYCQGISEIGGTVVCKARLYGGEEDKPSIGVWLDLCEPEGLSTLM